MLIDCPGCARSYQVGHADLGERGRTVMCPRCGTRWHQGAPGRAIAAAAVSARPQNRSESRLDEPPVAPPGFRLPRGAVVGAGAALCCLAVASLVVGKDTIVRTMPRAAALYATVGLPVNVVGLAFVRIAPERSASSDVTIRGALRNVTGRKVRVPRLAFEVRDVSGATLVAWSETLAAKALPAGREVGFASAPHRLPAESRTVLVRFE